MSDKFIVDELRKEGFSSEKKDVFAKAEVKISDSVEVAIVKLNKKRKKKLFSNVRKDDGEEITEDDIIEYSPGVIILTEDLAKLIATLIAIEDDVWKWVLRISAIVTPILVIIIGIVTR